MSKNLCYLDLNTASKHYFFYSIFNELLSYLDVLNSGLLFHATKILLFSHIYVHIVCFFVEFLLPIVFYSLPAEKNIQKLCTICKSDTLYSNYGNETAKRRQRHRSLSRLFMHYMQYMLSVFA